MTTTLPEVLEAPALPVAPPRPTTAISVVHQPDGEPAESVDLLYRIDTEGTVRIIACEVRPESRYSHRWLVVRKFEVRMRLTRSKYTLLHSPKNDSVNRDTALFIDEVWAAIMKREGLVIAG